MKTVRLAALLAVLSGLTVAASAPNPALAQTPDAAPHTAAPTLPEALSSLVMITYACQAVSGPQLYSQADDLARQVTLRMTGDVNITAQFMKTAEDHAETACPDTTTCWHELLDAGEAATPDNGKAACQSYSASAASMVADLVTGASGDSRSESPESQN
ncbi:hypothetical protein [Asticcacaulis sp. EMRT-3]|uniref:hypothetical protein n=1 Tax=Asticcacaulis sp. EMRT-3 TaxID=3040349 RepID=UPI0024AF54F8|nr:hypothetical protein [Asticcacaulis sp. EMRT-3]MDI7774123.1 hypothetical protein [Asticcacaulis sp. EMRT-3]